MMRLSKLAAIAVVPALSCTLLAGCGSGFHFKVSSGGATATCSVSTQGGNCSANGHSVTVAPDSGHASGPAVRDSSTPVPTVSTSTPQPTASPVVATSAAPTPTEDAVTSVQNCMSQFPTQPKDTLVSFTTSSGDRQNMATCLQIPPQTMALFLRLLFQYAVDALRSGQLSTQQGVTQFTSSTSGETLPHAVQRCRDEA